MSWKDLFKPDDKDPKNIVEWLGLITDEIKKFKNSDNWYDTVKLITDASIIDNLETDVGDFALSARQGYILNQKLILSNDAIDSIKENISTIETEIAETNSKIEDIKENDLDPIKNCIENIVLVLIENAINLNDHESKLDILDERTSIIEDDIENHDDRITNNENSIIDINTSIDSLIGSNVKISGLDVSINNENLELIISEGKAIIQGNIVEIDEPIIIDIDQVLLEEPKLLYVLIKYVDNSIIAELSESDMDITSLRIHTLLVGDGTIVEGFESIDFTPFDSIIGLTSDKEADTIRETIPSGFTTLGELDFEYMQNNENQLKFKTKSIAYIHGYKLEIPKDTIINIDKLPEKECRDDLVFLEALKDTDFHKTGKLSWRLRYVSNVDFIKYNKDGITSNTKDVVEDKFNNLYCSVNSDLINPECRYRNNLQRKEFNPDGIQIHSNISCLALDDVGLFIAGSGNDKSKSLLSSEDGYVYAIPMFRLYRRPSCGKLKPYEFNKINKLCHYTKVRKLVQSERVEKVKSEIINGISLLNHCTSMKELSVSGVASTNTTIENNSFSLTTTTNGSSVIITKELLSIKPSTEYSVIIKNINSNVELFIGDRIDNGGFLNTFIPSTKLVSDNINIIKFTTGESFDNYCIWIGRSDSIDKGSTINIMEMMILEGDWTNSMYIPEYFEGISSLGAQENNVVIVKNGIINEDTYNVNTENQKLNTFQDVTYISSDNIILPTVEAIVKNGEDETPLESLNTKLETTGQEIIEFTKIKGRTIQNLAIDGIVNNGTFTYSNNICEVTYSSPNLSGIDFRNMLKPNTTYTYIINVIENNINTDNESSIKIQLGDGNQFGSVKKGFLGIIINTVNTTSNISESFSVLVRTSGATSGKVKFSGFMLLEGDHRNIPLEELPFVEGIKSVGEYRENKISLRSNNRNLISKDMYTNTWFHSLQGDYELDLNDKTGKKYSIYNIKTFGLTNLKLTCNKEFNRLIYRGKDTHNNILYKGDLGDVKLTEYIFSDIPENIVTLDLYVSSSGIDDSYDFMLKEIDDTDNYIEHKSTIQNIYLKEPLRSLPNGTCDEIVGNKIIRRVGKFIINPNDLIVRVTGVSGKKRWVIKTDKSIANISGRVISCLSNKFPSVTALNTWDEFIDGIAQNNSYNTIYLYLERYSDGSEESKQALINELGNDTVVYYELVNPIEEYIEQVYDKESIKTYQLDAPLRSLPNGIKDEIKDGILIRRLGEIILDGSDDEAWDTKNQDNTTTMHFQTGNLINSKIVTRPEGMLTSNFKVGSAWENTNINEGIIIGRTNQTGFDIRIKRSRLSSENKSGFIKWLQANPIKVIYELSYPIEIPLIETNSQSVDYSLNRQFKEGNYLRELPNGIKDTIENGKVIRRIGKKIYNGNSNEGWEVRQHNNPEYTVFTITSLNDSNNKPFDNDYSYTRKNILFSNMFESRNNVPGLADVIAESKEQITCLCNNVNTQAVYITILSSRLSTQDLNGFKKWLTQNPVIVFYELKTSIEEEMNNTNYSYYPSHNKFNTYCSSLYIGDGNNNVLVLDNIKSTDNLIKSEYRSIENSSDVIDTRYKPSVYGKEISNKISSGKNKINMYDYILNEHHKNVIVYKDGNSIKYSSNIQNSTFPFRYFINLKPNTKYTISCNIVSESDRGCIYVNHSNHDTAMTVDNFNTNNLCKLTKSDNVKTFITGNDGSIIVCTNIYSSTSDISFSIDSLQIEEGVQKTQYEEFIPDVRVFENVENDDIVDIRKTVSLSGFNYEQMLNKTLHLLMIGEI